MDDYISCKSAGFTNDEILNPVQGNGEYAASLPLFGGLNVWKAKNKILDTIAVTGNLLSRGEVMHSYMHCWRHKTPLIYRATNQWFIRMDEANADTQASSTKTTRRIRYARPLWKPLKQLSSFLNGAKSACTT